MGLHGSHRAAATLALAAALLATGCGASAPARSQPPPRSAAIYASVVKQVVRDHARVKVVYVLDGPVPGAADPMRTRQEPTRRFSEAVKTDLKRLAPADPPIRFVRRRAMVVTGDHGGTAPGHVVNGGILVTLGPIRGHGTPVRVGVGSWRDGLDGRWETYVVEWRGGAWVVSGTTGPAAIS